ncbi:cysteine proteinase RD21A-like [Coffea eugenioides]|uniref:cysteine proteinase RD21A-like n=1 Tax=Coffea eugenioides TaxID=49369 RepID=UPI000F61102D|nr:cysteine proteinase RD21A-like [Coffea eugenioides]
MDAPEAAGRSRVDHSCSGTRTYNLCCNGSIRDYAFDFIIANGEDDYPYEGLNGIYDPSRKNARVVSIDGYEDVPPYSEKALQKAMAHQPVSVAIEASGRAFQLYVSGIFTGACIKPLVGYGSENGKDHCVVRNSCGEKTDTLGWSAIGGMSFKLLTSEKQLENVLNHGGAVTKKNASNLLVGLSCFSCRDEACTTSFFSFNN